MYTGYCQSISHRFSPLSFSQVMYFSSLFPYVVLICFLVRGLLLRGAVDGILHMLTPKVSPASLLCDLRPLDLSELLLTQCFCGGIQASNQGSHFEMGESPHPWGAHSECSAVSWESSSLQLKWRWHNAVPAGQTWGQQGRQLNKGWKTQGLDSAFYVFFSHRILWNHLGVSLSRKLIFWLNGPWCLVSSP